MSDEAATPQPEPAASDAPPPNPVEAAIGAFLNDFMTLMGDLDDRGLGDRADAALAAVDQAMAEAAAAMAG